MDHSIESQHVVIVGGTSGMGLAAARVLKSRGARVTVTGRDPVRLDQARSEGFVAAAVDALSDKVVADFFAGAGKIDHLVICVSGAKGAGPFATLDVDTLTAGFAEKVMAQIRVARAALATLRRDGSLTFITAASARASLPGTAGLAMINGALEAMVKPLARELQPLRVNAVSPGVVETAWWDRLPAATREQVLEGASKASLVKRNGSAEELGEAIAFVVGAGFMTGSVLEIDGGVRLT